MGYTPNLNLAKPVGTDKVDVSILNGNMDSTFAIVEA